MREGKGADTVIVKRTQCYSSFLQLIKVTTQTQPTEYTSSMLLIHCIIKHTHNILSNPFAVVRIMLSKTIKPIQNTYLYPFHKAFAESVQCDLSN